MSREADEKQAGTGDIGVAPGSAMVGPATSEALKAIEAEHQMTLRDTFRFWPKAILFSFVLSLAVIMEGYDTNLMSNFYPFPAFKNHYGDQDDPDGGRLISARWQTSISNATQVGSILGLLLNGWLSERIGYKKTMIGSMGFLIGAIFIPFFSTGLPMFVASGIVQGIPWGIFQTLAVTYAADVCPTALRAYMTSWINMCWVIGILISNGVLKGLLQIDSQWGYRIPFAVQWVWPIPIIIGTIFAPESPWWLVRKGRLDDAKAALRDLTSPKPGIEFDIDAQVELMRLTNEYERELSTGAHYWDCFRGVDRRRTEIVCLVWITQSLCGVPFMSYGIQFMQQAGLNASAAYSLNLGQSGLGLVGCILAWFIMTYVGRRTMYVGGLAFIFVILMIIGFLGIPEQTEGISWAMGGLIIFMLFGFQLSLGPACYSLVSEIPSTRLRIKTVALSRASYNIAGFITNALMPPMVGKNDWNWGPKAAYFWAGIDFAFLTWTFFRLPEPKDLTYTELDLLFEHGVSARKFTREAADALKFELGDVTSRQEKVAVQHEE